MSREVFYGNKGGLAVALLLQDSKTALISKALFELDCIDKLLKGFLLLGKDKIFFMLIDIFRGKLMTKDSKKGLYIREFLYLVEGHTLEGLCFENGKVS